MTDSVGFFSIDDVISSYVAWLEVKPPEHRAGFVRRIRNDREGAQAEALTFALLRTKRQNPMPAEHVETGGVDFLCRPELLMGARAAEELLTGTTVISVRVGDVAAEPELVAKLQNSVFFRVGASGNVEPARRSISAILLMNIQPSGVNLIGLLHPAPAHPFDIRTLDSVHFIRLREWPITDRFGIEWIGPPPSPTFVPHWVVTLEDRELR